MQDYVKEWIESINSNVVKCKKKSLIGSDDYFLNFNYTDILEKTYGIENVLHIHGGVSSICDIPPIIGHCNKLDIERHRKWAKEADEEGFHDLAERFRKVGAIEKRHEERYRELLHNVQMKKVFEKSGQEMWECRVCGHIVVGEKAPEVCPVCKYSQSYFEIHNDKF